MKKILLLCIFLFITHLSSAPNISSELKEEMRVRGVNEYNRLMYEKEFTLFVNHLGFKESNNDWTIVNTINCLGEWQFAHTTLSFLGYGHITPAKFRKDPSIFPRELQLKVLKELMEVNELSLRNYESYIGRTINGILITKAGLLAGMHLGGSGGVQIFLMTEGRVDKDDAYGTRISDYIKEFSIYDLNREMIPINKIILYEPFNFSDEGTISVSR